MSGNFMVSPGASNPTYTISTITNTVGPQNFNYVPSGCTCGAWLSVLPPPPCPVHSGMQQVQHAPLQGCFPMWPDWPDFDLYEEEVTNEEAIAGLLEIAGDLE